MTMIHFPWVKTEIEIQLTEFSQGLKTPEDKITCGVALCENVFRMLEATLSLYQKYGMITYSIASRHYAGSVAKRTDVINPDFDLVLRLHHQRPPFTRVLNLLKEILISNAVKLHINSGSIKLSPFSIQFCFTNGMAVDLLPATADMSMAEICAQIGRNPEQNRYYSSSLTTRQVAFMKQQSSLAHDVARLAKYWFKKLDFGDANISGGSTIMELVAVAATLDTKNTSNHSIFSAFKEFLDKIRLINCMSIRFLYNHCSATWRQGRASRPHERSSAKLLEPSNESNNILDGVSEQARKILSEQADKALRRLLSANCVFRVDMVNKKVTLDMNKLFEDEQSTSVPQMNSGLVAGPVSRKRSFPEADYSFKRFAATVNSGQVSTTAGTSPSNIVVREWVKIVGATPRLITYTIPSSHNHNM